MVTAGETVCHTLVSRVVLFLALAFAVAGWAHSRHLSLAGLSPSLGCPDPIVVPASFRRRFHPHSVGGSGEAADTGRPAPPASRKRPAKQRLDALLMERHPEYSKNVIQGFIAAGEVWVGDRPVTKAGAQVRPDEAVDLRADPPAYVCRAGMKLAAALDAFDLNVTGLRVLDAGMSTGGFVDCLLQRGAAQVYGVDVGYGQVAHRIRTDPRVVLVERTNLRYLDALPGGAPPVDLVTLDLSFISVLLVMPTIATHLLAHTPEAQMVVLLKPQFEGTRQEIGKGGVVRDPAARDRIVNRTVSGIERFGFRCSGLIESPLKGAKGGNAEYLAHFRRTHPLPPNPSVLSVPSGPSVPSDRSSAH